MRLPSTPLHRRSLLRSGVRELGSGTLRRGLVALGLSSALFACQMPPIPDGVQLLCASDGECPSGTSCANGCCVRPGETPSCPAANGLGTACTGGNPFDDAGLSRGTCPGNTFCFNERQTGLPGGMCTRPCDPSAGCPIVGDCVDVTRLELPWPSLCLRKCAVREPPASDCRPGYSCQCVSGSCNCFPQCAQGTCTGETDAGPNQCVASGLCRPAPGADAGPDAGPGAGDAG